MKTLLLTLTLLFTSITASAQVHEHEAANDFGTHGMLMLGTSKVYLSHLPMFHQPHDYQAIIEVKLPKEINSAYLKSKSTSPTTLYTLLPEPMSLKKTVLNQSSFKAQIYKGHFERGGKPITATFTVEITDVIYFNQFVAGAKKPTFHQAILFGNDSEQFLAHLIVAKPDFDQITTLKPNAQTLELTKNQQGLLLELSNFSNDKALPSQTINQGKVQATGQHVPVEVESEIYLEHGDLKM